MNIHVVLLLVFTAACAAPNPTLRVMAYNVKHGRGMDGRVDLARAAAVIRAHDPDVVTLQEIDNGCGRTGGVDQAAALAELCGMHEAFGAFMEYDGGHYGMALMTKLPLLDARNHELPRGAEPRTALDARVLLDDNQQEVIVTGIHFYRTQQERLAQARALAAVYDGEALPVILAGDFNSRPGDAVLAFLEQQWLRVEKGGQPMTFPSRTPDREIDFVLLRPAERFRVIRHWVVDEPMASDHLPIVIDLEVLPAPR